MKKKILYLDLDGVVADFDFAIKQICPELETDLIYQDYETKSIKIDEVVANNPNIFQTLPPIKGATEAVPILFELFDVYFLSTPMWDIPESFMGKRLWVEKQFGAKATNRRLILTHRKDLNIGDFLVDDRLKNGSSEFTGEHIHFATEKYPNWDVTLEYLKSVA